MRQVGHRRGAGRGGSGGLLQAGGRGGGSGEGERGWTGVDRCLACWQATHGGAYRWIRAVAPHVAEAHHVDALARGPVGHHVAPLEGHPVVVLVGHVEGVQGKGAPKEHDGQLRVHVHDLGGGGVRALHRLPVQVRVRRKGPCKGVGQVQHRTRKHSTDNGGFGTHTHTHPSHPPVQQSWPVQGRRIHPPT